MKVTKGELFLVKKLPWRYVLGDQEAFAWFKELSEVKRQAMFLAEELV